MQINFNTLSATIQRVLEELFDGSGEVGYDLASDDFANGVGTDFCYCGGSWGNKGG